MPENGTQLTKYARIIKASLDYAPMYRLHGRLPDSN